MIIDIVTIFPKMFLSIVGESIIKRGIDKGLVKINLHDLRDYAKEPHKKVDAPSYGGGGMVFRVEPVFEAIEGILGCSIYPENKKNSQTKVVLMSPKGRQLNQKMSRCFLKYERLIVLAPRYEGVDERIRYIVDEEISIGDYVLSGGELPAMVFVDSLVRLIPGVVSDQESIKCESFEKNALDFPHYTRPEEFRGIKVPEVLLSGDHAKINKWREDKSLEITKEKRPDLLRK
ncbi:MAG: tRNA (guanosine(37)-N1)-methyltransferase TrmD [Candidatus Omnitrophica bacterium]|nr:tRNA (guanosine(37)-N1)-methyltransferase TrmD [Candidatus Omnitrophota bacterium]